MRLNKPYYWRSPRLATVIDVVLIRYHHLGIDIQTATVTDLNGRNTCWIPACDRSMNRADVGCQRSKSTLPLQRTLPGILQDTRNFSHARRLGWRCRGPDGRGSHDDRHSVRGIRHPGETPVNIAAGSRRHPDRHGSFEYNPRDGSDYSCARLRKTVLSHWIRGVAPKVQN